LALDECLKAAAGIPVSDIALWLCVAERGRAGRLQGLDRTLLQDVEERLGSRFHADSNVVSDGRLSGATALDQARRTMASRRGLCIIAGVDGLLVGQTLTAFEKRRRLLTASNSDGFIPGEAAGAVLIGPASSATPPLLQCLGIGYGTEPATIESDQPLQGNGLAQAFRSSLADAGVDWAQVDYQISAVSGEQYGFKETALAALRTIRPVKHGFDLWHPSDCIGEVGAAIVPCMLGVALTAARKGYAPGSGVLCHVAADDDRRAAIVLGYSGGNR
jgi:3-oxoacyl-[acyl-carrier-protein] synthase I